MPAKKLTKVVAILFAALVLMTSSCSFKEAKDVSERAVSDFHDKFNAGQYHEIYAQSDSRFRTETNEPDLVTFFEAIHRKLGAFKSSSASGFFVNATTFGTQVTLTYETDFSEGKATERFDYAVSSGKALLIGYHINSPLLIIK
ncbi:MAG TPA: hypothetical protein VFC63_24510 [Blastocatellia bacterium]|nr:hypothetical protein [Blastocatellia bacterium]